MAVRIQFRRGTAAEWAAANPVLASGELGYETDTRVIKFGDGATNWTNLPAAAAGDITGVIAGTGLTGGASSGQATLNINTSYVVTAAQIQYPGDVLVGASAGAYSVLPIGEDGAVLLADSGETLGLKWAMPQDNAGAFIPTGSVISFAGSTAPNGFLLCDGSAVSRTTYNHLFAVVGSTYGSGDGSSTFNLPNLKGKVITGYDSTQAEFNPLGTSGGFKTHQLTIGELPVHNHGGSISGGNHGHPVTVTPSGSHIHNASTPGADGTHSHTPGVLGLDGVTTFPVGPGPAKSIWRVTPTYATVVPDTGSGHGHSVTVEPVAAHTHTTTIPSVYGTHSHTIGYQGGDNAHNNLQPYLVLNYIIKI